MTNQIQEIAQRLRGLRDASDLGIDQVSERTGIPAEIYRQYEDGTLDVPMSTITILATLFGVDPSTILTGVDPHAKTARVTRKGCGAIVERGGYYRYEALSVLFAGKQFEPFIVTVDPAFRDLHLNSHAGQEFNYVISGTLRLSVDGQVFDLNEGDSIYFDSTRPHGMLALGGKPAKFLAIIKGV